ncbi:MAG: haloacid dehalogenase-like hydrolase [Bacteroidales bacterium]|jgi:HAD superfamily hydrolase (TIGR01490 family)|nr:haloacid dehalogenase-like hydrolase [Bacteroidales bacterium]
MKQITAFDFDGTITNKDTFVEFIKFSRGKCRFYMAVLIFLPLLTAMKLKIYPNWKVKQRIFSYFFKGTKQKDFDYLCEKFCNQSEYLLRKKAIEAINQHIENGDILVIVSASIENWVRFFAQKLNIPIILCTKIEIDVNDCITGYFSTKNCYGQEKVNRFLKEFPDRKSYELTAYGDSKGDKELLNFSNKSHYKTFKR